MSCVPAPALVFTSHRSGVPFGSNTERKPIVTGSLCRIGSPWAQRNDSPGDADSSVIPSGRAKESSSLSDSSRFQLKPIRFVLVNAAAMR